MNCFDYDLNELSDLLDKKQISSTEITRICLENIKNTDNKIGAFLTVCGDKALESSRRSDKRISEGRRLGKLDGIPYSLKDNICTRGIKTTCGSKMLESFVPPYNATCFEMLERAGAVLLGKVNMDEFAMGSTTNSAFNKTKNPLNPEFSVGGSSGGCAASVAAEQAFFSIGTDTGGSIRQPAAFCGLCGLKPTYGRISRNGLIAFASSMDTVGIIANKTDDLRVILEEIAGKDKLDATSLDFALCKENENLSDNLCISTIAIPKELMDLNISPEIRKNFEKALEIYSRCGARVEIVSIPEISYAVECYYILCCAEASSNLARYDGIRYGFSAQSVNTIEQLYENSRNGGFSDEVKRRILVGAYVLSDGYREKYYLQALKTKAKLAKAMEKIFNTFSFVASPTMPVPAFKLSDCGKDPIEIYKTDICTVLANLAGIPSISVPFGVDMFGLPTGFQLMGKMNSEYQLIKFAKTLEGQGKKR